MVLKVIVLCFIPRCIIVIVIVNIVIMIIIITIITSSGHLHYNQQQLYYHHRHYHYHHHHRYQPGDNNVNNNINKISIFYIMKPPETIKRSSLSSDVGGFANFLSKGLFSRLLVLAVMLFIRYKT